MKPLIIIKLPSLTQAELAEHIRINDDPKFTELRKDYHILVLNSNTDDADVQVFYEKDFTESKVGELKKEILKWIDKND